MSKEKPMKQELTSEPLFYLHELREHSQKLFGVKPEVIDGVFHDTEKIQFTKTEVQARVDAFLNRGVMS